MQDSDNLPHAPIVISETFLLWLAVGLAVVFLGLLAFDLYKRRRRLHRRHRREPEALRAKLLKPVLRAQALQSDLKQMLHDRARHKHRERPPPRETPP
jgi:uncharacterized iron-regulated membrane protein